MKTFRETRAEVRASQFPDALKFNLAINKATRAMCEANGMSADLARAAAKAVSPKKA